MKNVACIIARTNSTRLPKKVLRDVGGIMLIEYIIEKTKKSQLIDEIYLCTSTNENDKVLLDIAKKCGIKSYAGSLDSVIDRMLDVAKIENADNVVRITGDNIFTDEVYLDIMLQEHNQSNVDYTRTELLPIGITSEIMKVTALRECYSMMNPDESQYLMLYMFQPDVFKCQVIIPEEQHQKPNMTLTVDSPSDFERTLAIIGEQKSLLTLDTIIEICDNNSIPNTIYEGGGIVKFPANLSVYFDTYRKEMDLRIEKSKIVRLEEGDYSKVKQQQNV